MSLIDIKNLDRLTSEQRAQFDALLEQFPHLESKMSTSRELNTPTKIENSPAPKVALPQQPSGEEVDYSSFMVADSAPVDKAYRKEEMPRIQINPEESFLKSFDKEKEVDSQDEEKRRDEVKKAAEAAGLAPEIASFNPAGKTHPILQKMRATVGMRSVQPPVVVDIGGCKYSMKPLDRLAIVNASTLAVSTTSNPLGYQTNLEVAIISFSVVAIDGVPLYEIFSIPEEEIVEGKKVIISKMDREERAAKEFYIELLKSPNELIETLGVYYQQEFPSLSLIGKDKAKFMCPVADCLQARIAEITVECFCPVHGEKMAREDQLPNPL